MFDFGAKMQFYAVFALGFALLWVPAMIFVHYWVRATKSRALGEKGVHWFFPAFESPCISSLPCIGIPCMGLRAIYVPASVLNFVQNHPATAFWACAFPCNPALQRLRKWLCLFFDFSQIIWNRLASCEWCSHRNCASKKIIRFYRYFLACKDNRNRLKSFQSYKSLYKKAHGHDKIIKSCCSYKTEFIWWQRRSIRVLLLSRCKSLSNLNYLDFWNS